MSITPRDGKSMFWKDEFTVTFSQVRKWDPVDISGIYDFDGFAEELADANTVVAEKCDGGIDMVNGESPPPRTVYTSGLLEVQGWLALSVDRAVLPEAVYIVLTDSQGKHRYLRTRAMLRPDVGAAFKRPELEKAGYRTLADISSLEGEFNLGVAARQANKVEICPQFKVSTTVTR
jgi:hypothetical protein